MINCWLIYLFPAIKCPRPCSIMIPRTEGVFYLFGGRADRAIFTSSSCGRPLGSLGPKGPKCWSIITLQRGYVILQDTTPQKNWKTSLLRDLLWGKSSDILELKPDAVGSRKLQGGEGATWELCSHMRSVITSGKVLCALMGVNGFMITLQYLQ